MSAIVLSNAKMGFFFLFIFADEESDLLSPPNLYILTDRLVGLIK
jgi:hypothetical protein